jgi:sn-glycerol 3-phosphate transport system ATP-binding protein
VAGISISRVSRTFGTVRAVDNVSLEVGEGEFFTLLGPSGCGKTTLLRMIAGFCELDRGKIRFGRERIDRLPAHLRDIGMVFQNYAVFPNLTVAGNVAYGLKARKVAAPEAERRVEQALALVQLSGYGGRWPHQLSGGQLQRVAIARCLVIEPAVLLLDEPLSNLDAQLRVEMRREIRSLQQRLGMTMLYVTHDQVEAMTMADQVVLMRNGRIEQDAAPAVLYERPATIFAARFVGTPPMNVLPASLIPADAHWARAAIPAGHTVDQLAIGIRPEAARLVDDGLPATVAAVEYLGADTLIDTRVADQSFVVRLPGRATAAVGSPVHIVWEPAVAHWFDLSTQCRIDR